MNKAPLVMAVDHEPGVLRLIKHELGARGYRVLTAHRASEAERIAIRERPDIMLVDVETPELPGLEVIRQLRERTSAPIILLGHRGREYDKRQARALGVTDYLEKPFQAGELNRRVRGALQHVPGAWSEGASVRRDGIEIDLNRRTVRKDGAIVQLTRTEWLLLKRLADSAGQPVPAPELAAAIWADASFIPHLRTWISRLRHKLEEDPAMPRLIVTARRLGYMLAASASPDWIDRSSVRQG